MKDFPIEFRAFFADVNRVSSIEISWRYKPEKAMTLATLDGTIFYDLFDWEDAEDEIGLDPPIYIIGFKLIMKKPSKGDYIGFNSINAVFDPLTM